uniref:Uncharacterized protein n=1 Tax=Physcomitrium patens TaxID=3218 RepID=A0A2K1IC90_PHYPA|nr:hypothetical protein PHYPA_030368 [Physcomitrium patens]
MFVTLNKINYFFCILFMTTTQLYLSYSVAESLIVYFISFYLYYIVFVFEKYSLAQKMVHLSHTFCDNNTSSSSLYIKNVPGNK